MAPLFEIVAKANTFTFEKEVFVRSCPSLNNGMILKVDNAEIGLVNPKAAILFLEYTKEFETDDQKRFLILSPQLDSIEKRTQAIHRILEEARSKKLFKCLDGWRYERFQVYGESGVLFEVERAAIGLLGVRAAGCHLNGYVKMSDGSVKMWIAIRSFTKQTYPGLFDNIVGGLLFDLTKRRFNCWIESTAMHHKRMRRRSIHSNLNCLQSRINWNNLFFSRVVSWLASKFGYFKYLT